MQGCSENIINFPVQLQPQATSCISPLFTLLVGGYTITQISYLFWAGGLK